MSPRSPFFRSAARRRSPQALGGLMLLGASVSACAAPPDAKPPEPPVSLQEVAAHAGHNLIHAMRAGDAVRLEADPRHPFERNAVAAYWGAFKLGYLPREALANLRCPPACMVGDELPMGRIVMAESGAISVEIVMPPWTMARMAE
jgi:hypothetical protein